MDKRGSNSMLIYFLIILIFISVGAIAYALYWINNKIDLAVAMFVNKTQPKPKARSVSYFNPHLKEKKKPKVHDDAHGWAVENGAIVND